MGKARKPRQMRCRAKSLPECIREFLTPAVWKQARQEANRRKKPRWDVHPLCFVLLAMTWCCGDSLPEKFETARGFYVACHPKRRRPGETFQGFQQALERLPMGVLRRMGKGIRGRIEALFGSRLLIDGFIPLGCDGSRLECPRSEELERRLGKSGKRKMKRKSNSKGNGDKKAAAPTVWITAVVHLCNGVPWMWRFGKGGKASEREHLRRMLHLLPKLALVVTDAGYYGYELISDLIRSKADFLIRMSTNVKLYTEEHVEMDDFCEGVVYYWPEAVQRLGGEPIRARLIRLRGRSKKRKYDVWLLTNVMDSKRLSSRMADRFYRWRWESEGYFRTYKWTMAKLKMSSRTVRCVHREAEASMIATQLLLAQGALAMPEAKGKDEAAVCSPRQVLREIRREISGGVSPRRRRHFEKRLRECYRERRGRKTVKEKRVWPRRKEHKPPGPPQILTLTRAQKCLLLRPQTAV
jgi:hypothetical protein